MNQLNELNDFIQTASKGEIRETLDFLLNECSLDEAPSLEEVAYWQTILTARGGAFRDLAQMCADFVNEIGETS